MIYLNNAATSYPKPKEVLEVQEVALSLPPESQHRSNSVAGGKDTAGLCREKLSRLLGITCPGRIFFTSGATESLNRIFRGLPKDCRTVIATQTEHNSVLRPIYNIPGFEVAIAACDGTGRVDPSSLEEAFSKVRGDKGVVVVNHCSNVTGAVQDVPALAKAAHRHGFQLLLDASQSAGCLPVETESWGVDLLAFTGHKALFGPRGTGGWYAAEGVEISPLFFGGTGSDSDKYIYGPSDTPPQETGTQNLPGIAGLLAGAEYVLARGITDIQEYDASLRKELKERLDAIPHVMTYGPAVGGPVLSFNIKGIDPSDAGYILQNEFGITVRTGLHCSPLIHKALGSTPGGTLRAGISCLNTHEDIMALAGAVRQISEGI